jgi:ATP-dependent Lon protease
LKEIPENIKQDLTIKPVRWVDEVLSSAINGYPERLPRKNKKVKTPLVGVNKKLRKNDRIRTH